MSEENALSMEKKQKRQKHRKRFLKVLLGFLIVLAVFIAVTTVISLIGVQSNINKAHSYGDAGCAQLDFEKTDAGYINIKSDNGLKVMQLTDVHIGGGWMSIQKDSMAINAVAAMIKAEKPDFVVVTGDISYPVPFQAGTFNNKSGAKVFAELMETLGVYWTLAYGNHDTEAYSFYSREQLTAFYQNGDYPHCLLEAGPEDVDGVGNQILNVVNSDGVITRSMVVLDSHSYIDGDYFGIKWYYDNMHDNQIAWYKDSLIQLSAQNQQTISALSSDKAAQYKDFPQMIPSSVFFHIPMEEYKLAWNEYVENGYQDTENLTYNYGVPGESGKVVFCGVHPDNLFETMAEVGSTDTVFCGHDHYNNFSIKYKGIYLNYGMSIDYLAYIGISKVGTQRGCTILNYDDAGAIDFHTENYYQDKYRTDTRETVTMQELTTQGIAED